MHRLISKKGGCAFAGQFGNGFFAGQRFGNPANQTAAYGSGGARGAGLDALHAQTAAYGSGGARGTGLRDANQSAAARTNRRTRLKWSRHKLSFYVGPVRPVNAVRWRGDRASRDKWLADVHVMPLRDGIKRGGLEQGDRLKIVFCHRKGFGEN